MTLRCCPWPIGDRSPIASQDPRAPTAPHVNALNCRVVRWVVAAVEDQSMQATQLDPDVEAHLRAADLTYDHVAGTRGVLPDGFHHLSRQMIIGLGTARFADAAQALLAGPDPRAPRDTRGEAAA